MREEKEAGAFCWIRRIDHIRLALTSESVLNVGPRIIRTVFDTVNSEVLAVL
jgi:hypothetical protein